MTSGMQETLRAVMRIEWSVDLELAVPLSARELSEEVKVVRGWLGSSELFGRPQILTEGSQPVAPVSNPEPQGVVAESESQSAGGAVGADMSLVSFPGLSPARTILTPLWSVRRARRRHLRNLRRSPVPRRSHRPPRVVRNDGCRCSPRMRTIPQRGRRRRRRPGRPASSRMKSEVPCLRSTQPALRPKFR